MGQITRTQAYFPALQMKLQRALKDTPEIKFSEMIGGMIYVPAGTPPTTLAFYVAPRQSSQPDPLTPAQQPQPAQNYYALLNAQGQPVTLSVQSQVQPNGEAGNAYDLTVLLSTVGLCSAGSLKITANPPVAVELTLTS